MQKVNVKDPFVFHKSDHEDEMFLVLRGRLKLEIEDKTLEIGEGKFIIIPKNSNHEI